MMPNMFNDTTNDTTNDMTIEGVVTGTPVDGSAEAGSEVVPESSFKLFASADKDSLSHGEEHTVHAMLSIRAPQATSERPPLDLVVCIDVSGSMRSDNKMHLTKQTVQMLIERSGLKDYDRLSIVTFDRRVTVKLPLTNMDADGRERASCIVKNMEPGSTTNLSGGLLQAIDVLDQDKGGEGRSRSVLLFTDGLPTEGVTDASTIVRVVKSALDTAKDINLFTFGFGNDHDAQCLKEIAASSGPGGLYYNVRTAEEIPQAFANCLGGLVSVVAQNAKLLVHGAERAKLPLASVSRVLGGAYPYNPKDGSIELGDLYAGDKKDVVLELELPALPEPSEAHQTLLASLGFFDLASATKQTVKTTLSIGRPLETPPDQAINEALEAQRMRIEAAEVMEEASRLADEGNFDAGRAKLKRTQEMVSLHPDSSVGSAIARDLEQLMVAYDSGPAVYRSLATTASMAHKLQRSNHSMPQGVYGGGSAAKAKMQEAWQAAGPSLVNPAGSVPAPGMDGPGPVLSRGVSMGFGEAGEDSGPKYRSIGSK